MPTSDVAQVTEMLNAAAQASAEEGNEDEQQQSMEGQEENEEQQDTDLAGGEDEEEIEAYKLSELAERYEIDPDELYQAKIVLGDGDDAQTVSIEQIKDTWKRANAALNEFDGIRGAIDQQRNELDKQRSMFQMQAALNVPPTQEELDAQFEFAEMDRLEKNSEWWSRLEKESGLETARQALNRVRDAKRHAEEKLKNFGTARQQQQEQILQQINTGFEQELANRLPTWKDQAVMKQDFDGMKRTAADFGVSEQELMSSRDPRLWHMLAEFSKLRALAANGPKPKKPTGKGRRPKSRTSKSQQSKAQLDQQIAAAKESKDERAKTAAVTALLRGL